MQRHKKWIISDKDMHYTAVEILRHYNFSGTPAKITEDYLKALNEVMEQLKRYNKSIEDGSIS